MAAYAALVSLLNTMDQVQIHPRHSASFNKKHFESLGETVGFLLDFIESYNGGGRSKEVEDLESKIASAAHAAEDAIESHIVDQNLAESQECEITPEADDAIESHVMNQILAGSTKIIWGLLQKMLGYVWKRLIKLHQPIVICDLQKVIEDMDSIKEDVRKVEKQGSFKDQTPNAASSRPVSARKTSMVGFDDYLIHLMDRLTGQQSHRLVIPIIGMGGIGKTTLARNAFDNLLIKQYFDICAWTTVSQNYSVRDILLQLLSSQEGSANFTALDVNQLGENVHKCLFNRRYLIILDDTWSIEVWDEIKFFFPDNSNGSRIIVTSRLHDISLHFNSPFHAINLLDEDKSWKLFCQESFGEKGCPAELEEVGKKICGNCKGLPLSIVVIGGFLQRSCKSQEYWMGVERDTYAILSSERDNQCMNILSLSYTHLPAHLKPCFLYMGIFAEDEEIIVPRLIKLWVAEGFLRPDDARSLEEVAEGYLKDLVDRNLILVNKWGSRGKMRACSIHDLIRELCLRIAEKEKFLCVINRKRHILTARERMSSSKVFLALSSASLFNSSTCKVLHRGSLEAALRCVNLRFLDLQFDGFGPQRIPKNIYFLWNLQTVIIEDYLGYIFAPFEIWEMVQLRHLKVDSLCLPNPLQNDRVDLILPNLQTLWMADNLRLSEEVCKRIPNVKKLGLYYCTFPHGCDRGSYYYPQNVGRFHKLESLVLKFLGRYCRHIVLNMTFPSSLKKLSLYLSYLNWEDLEMIGSLPNLEVLKLRELSMKGSVWNPVEGEFCCLKFLQIHSCYDLRIWNADHSHFPVLEKLDLLGFYDLDEIPSGIGEIPTLRIIQVRQCSVSCCLSAIKILEEQESLGNDDLQVEIEFGFVNNDERWDKFREIMEEEGGFTSKNLHIKGPTRSGAFGLRNRIGLERLLKNG